MRVKAKKTVFYNGYRKRVGDEFVLKDPKHFSKSSMEKVVEAPKPATPATSAPKGTQAPQQPKGLQVPNGNKE